MIIVVDGGVAGVVVLLRTVLGNVAFLLTLVANDIGMTVSIIISVGRIVAVATASS